MLALHPIFARFDARALHTVAARCRSVAFPAGEKIMQQVMGIAMAENAVMPIYFLKSSWGVSRKLNLAPSGDQYTKATNIRPTKP